MESGGQEKQIDVFEVFKLKSIPTSAVTNMSFEQIRAKYTILKPVSSLDDLKDVDTLATLPNQGMSSTISD